MNVCPHRHSTVADSPDIESNVFGSLRWATGITACQASKRQAVVKELLRRALMTMCPFAWEGCLTQSRLQHPRRVHLAQTGTWQAWPPVDLSSTAFTVERVRYTLLYAMAAKVDRLFSTVAVGHPVATQIRARAQQIARQF